jgi:hypothetical protein
MEWQASLKNTQSVILLVIQLKQNQETQVTFQVSPSCSDLRALSTQVLSTLTKTGLDW